MMHKHLIHRFKVETVFTTFSILYAYRKKARPNPKKVHIKRKAGFPSIVYPSSDLCKISFHWIKVKLEKLSITIYVQCSPLLEHVTVVLGSNFTSHRCYFFSLQQSYIRVSLNASITIISLVIVVLSLIKKKKNKLFPEWISRHSALE